MEQPILSFLTAYFSDLHIQCRLTDRKQLELADLDLGLRNSILMQEADAQKQAPFPFVQNTIYFIVDYYECNYSFFRLPDKSAFLFVGPFLWKEFERSQILSLINRLDIPAELFPQLQEYYHALPLIADKASMTALLRLSDAGCRRGCIRTDPAFERSRDQRVLFGKAPVCRTGGPGLKHAPS